jgi:uncharacterized protein (DUF305 family)
MTHRTARTAARIAALALLAALPLAAPAARAQSTHGAHGAAAERPARPAKRHTAADVRFLHGMIAHHAQALAMAEMAPSRAAGDAVKLLAERIDVSQRDEIAAMRRWLAARGEPAEDPHAAHGAHAGMPGMLTPEQLAELAAARGAAFDRLFLQLMIRHHEGAIVMVKSLFGNQGAAQDGEIFALASDVDADQRAEIARMRALLAGIR